MYLVVDYSEKSVKSDYLGVIIYIWWREVRKIGIFAAQNAKHTANLYEDPEKLGSSPKITVWVFYMQNTPKTRVIQCDFSEKSGNSQSLVYN